MAKATAGAASGAKDKVVGRQGGPNQILLVKQVHTMPPSWRVPANYTP